MVLFVGRCGYLLGVSLRPIAWRCCPVAFELGDDVTAYPLVDDLCCCRVHLHILAVPFVSLREVGVYVLKTMARFGWYVVHSMVCFIGTAREHWCFTWYAGASGVMLRCLPITG